MGPCYLSIECSPTAPIHQFRKMPVSSSDGDAINQSALLEMEYELFMHHGLRHFETLTLCGSFWYDCHQLLTWWNHCVHHQRSILRASQYEVITYITASGISRWWHVDTLRLSPTRPLGHFGSHWVAFGSFHIVQSSFWVISDHTKLPEVNICTAVHWPGWFTLVLNCRLDGITLQHNIIQTEHELQCSIFLVRVHIIKFVMGCCPRKGSPNTDHLEHRYNFVYSVLLALELLFLQELHIEHQEIYREAMWHCQSQ